MKTSKSKRERTVGRRPKSVKEDMGTRAAILSAARHVIAGKGIDGTSIREVAEAARVNNAMIYYHFKNKVDLYRAVLADSFAVLDRIWEDEIFKSAAPVRKKIQKYVEGIIRFQHSNEELRRIISIEFATSGENCKWLAVNFFQRHYERLVSILRQGMRTGELKRFDHAVATSSLMGMIVQSFIYRPIAEYVTGKKLDLSIARFGKFVTGVFFDGLAAKKTYKKK